MAHRTEGVEETQIKMEEGNFNPDSVMVCSSNSVVKLAQKMLAEIIGTYFIIFAGCGSVAVNRLYGGKVTFPGICVTWGTIVMAMIYTLGHVSGAHFNPAVTATFAILGQFPWKEVPIFMISQLLGSILASGTLSLIMDVTPEAFFGTIPAGSNTQSLIVEIIISFLLMFVISGSSVDNRAINKLGGIQVGMTIMLNVFVGGPISGASMNPARSLGPAIVKHNFKGIWVYVVGPFVGVLAGGAVYKLLQPTNKSFCELTKNCRE